MIKYGLEHTLLPVRAGGVAAALALAAVIQHALPVKMLHTRMQLAPVHAHLHVHVVIHAAHGVYYFLYGRHIKADVVIHRYAAEQRAYGVHLALVAALFHHAAAREGFVYLIIRVKLVNKFAVFVI